MSKFSKLGHALYEGTVSIDFVGRRKLWYAISAVILVVAVFGLTVPKLNMGIEFEGGVEYRAAMAEGAADQEHVTAILDAVNETGIENATDPQANTSGEDSIRVQTEPLDEDEARQVSDAIRSVDGVTDISQDAIGPSWGQQVAERALIGLVVFLALVILLIWGYFREWKMSLAAIVALAHDVLITVGVYALSGFEVTPATVTGVLTILGFSLYDTVVVFDKVRENVRDLPRTHMTYAEAANLAVNQTLVRSINTSIVALLPVGALLYAGVFMLGSGALKDLSLSLFVGMAAGAYSSIFIATPLLVQLKEMEPGVRAGDARARKHKSRRNVDPFANVPVYTEDMPVDDDPGVEEEPVEEDRRTEGNRSVPPGAPGRVTAGERPPSARPVSGTSAAGRPQPSRRPRSRRGKG
ncbi:protein translocase subunit SecF [Nocardioides caldifontis]|uniref:protein translocase subunit SecF n=1 Tax=Nocardioides caldifontis TaxID=2588938 RepID=UPI0011DF6A43|nr:protein translocase subunit SecF [Nocardioides caldifontis]